MLSRDVNIDKIKYFLLRLFQQDNRMLVYVGRRPHRYRVLYPGGSDEDTARRRHLQRHATPPVTLGAYL